MKKLPQPLLTLLVMSSVAVVTPSLLSACAKAESPATQAPVAQQQPQQQPGMGMGRNRPTFEEFDLNGDGSITPDELGQARADRIARNVEAGKPMRNIGNMQPFEAIDTNGDKVIDRAEFTTHQQQHWSKQQN